MRALALAPLLLAACVPGDPGMADLMRPPPDLSPGESFATARASVSVTRVSRSTVALGTRVTNTLGQPICLSGVSARAYFASGRRADIAFRRLGGAAVRLDAPRGGIVAPGQSFGATVNAELLGLEAIRLRLEAERRDGVTTSFAEIRRDLARGEYRFELVYTYRLCGAGPGPNPWVTMTLGQTRIVRLG